MKLPMRALALITLTISSALFCTQKQQPSQTQAPTRARVAYNMNQQTIYDHTTGQQTITYGPNDQASWINTNRSNLRNRRTNSAANVATPPAHQNSINTSATLQQVTSTTSNVPNNNSSEDATSSLTHSQQNTPTQHLAVSFENILEYQAHVLFWHRERRSKEPLSNNIFSFAQNTVPSPQITALPIPNTDTYFTQSPPPDAKKPIAVKANPRVQ